jgi:tetratricopeptide (TPR) repeat protein
MHGVQYLWITAYYVKKERPGSRTAPFLARSLLMGSALYGLPVVVLAPVLAGRVTFDGGLELMLAAALNIHHIVLDSAIWKLRNAKNTQILIRGGESAIVPEAGRFPWVRTLVFASGIAGVVFTLWGDTEKRYGIRLASNRGDVERVEAAVRRMRWMGRDNANTRAQLGYMFGERGDEDRALAEFERSLALKPNATAWTNIGALRERRGEIEAALVAYDSAIALDPNDVAALHYAGRAFLRTGQPDRARPLLERAAELAPDRVDIREMLAEAARG